MIAKEFTVIRSPYTSDEIKKELRNYLSVESASIVKNISMQHELLMSLLRICENTYSTVNRDDIKVVKNGDRYDISFEVPVALRHVEISQPADFDVDFKCYGCGGKTIMGYCTNGCDD